jgi:hypothetical protein
MIFQYPSFLWALSALAIPILIHLFNFRKTIRVYFSNTRFLKQVKQETTQKRKLKQYLVLASRLLFLLFLVLAFAQPFLPASEQLEDQKNVIIYLDNSLSMSAPVAEKTRALDEAISRVTEILRVFPADVQYQLITNDFVPFSNSFKSKSEVLDFLSQIRLSSISRTASEIVNRTLRTQCTFFWLSDFQQATIGQAVRLDTTLYTKLIPIKFNKPSNVFIDTVFLENPFVIGGEKNAVNVRFRSNGEKRVEGLVTKLTINNVQASAATINLEPNGAHTLSIDLPSSLAGTNKAVISFSDYPVSFDNEFYFALDYSEKIRVIEIKSENKNSPIERVFGNKELFAFSSFLAANLNYSLLQSADLIIVNQLDKIDAPLRAALQALNESNSIFVIPGTKPDIESYRSFIKAELKLNDSDKNQVLLDQPDFKNPFFQSVFEEKSQSISMPFAIQLIDWGADRSAYLKFRDGRPFLSRVGSVYLMASPLEKSYTDISSHALFVPIMYRLAALANRSQQLPYYSLSNPVISIRADSIVGEVPVKMIGKIEVIPAQRRLNNRMVLDVPKNLLEKGFYSLTFQADTVGVVAYNLDKRESMLTCLTPEQAKIQFGGLPSVSILDASSNADFSSEIKERYVGKPLWKYAILLALLFLLMEVLLLRFLK